ncbi:MAG: hypothetical protein VW270_27950 [Candidatus Poseidoniales archaeon]
MIVILLATFQSSCATLEWSNKYGTDYCAYPSGVFVGVPTGIAAGIVAGPVLGTAMGVLAGGSMLLNSWTSYGGLDVDECIESYKRNVLEDGS